MSMSLICPARTTFATAPSSSTETPDRGASREATLGFEHSDAKQAAVEGERSIWIRPEIQRLITGGAEASFTTSNADGGDSKS